MLPLRGYELRLRRTFLRGGEAVRHAAKVVIIVGVVSILTIVLVRAHETGLGLLLGELRGAESVSFLRAINTGHPGSFSTIHANSLRGALEQLALMVMQTGIGLTRSDTIAYAASVIDVIVQLGRDANGKRGITRIADSRSLL